MSKAAPDEGLDARTSISLAAVRLFITQGYEATTVDQIARETGASRATLFRYFGSKEDILFHRYDREFDGLCFAVRGRKGSDARRTEAALLDVARRLQAEGDTFRLALELIARNPKLRARAFLTLHTWGCALARELTTGRDPDAEFPARVLAHSGVAALQEAMCLWLAKPKASLVDLTAEALHLALARGRRS